MKQVLISVVIVIYNMQREAPRTLLSLSPQYQGMDESLYEVIIIDNGSSTPLSDAYILELPRNFTYYKMPNPLPSPAAAINYGVKQSQGTFVGLMLDGARILTPGVLNYTHKIAKAYVNPVISTLGWHLGPDVQNRTVSKGYDIATEDKLLQEIAWPENGYRLFEISTFASSSKNGWFMPIAESNCIFLKRDTFCTIGGFEERFSSPGGGFVNLDFYKRAVEYPSNQLVILLGEGSFHQFHGGVATNIPEKKFAKIGKFWQVQYMLIRKCRFQRPTKRADFFGCIPIEAQRSLDLSVSSRLKHNHNSYYEPILHPKF